MKPQILLEILINCQNVPKSLLKRGREHLDIDGHHPSKKCRLSHLDTQDMEWFKGEISGMKENILGIQEYLKEEVGFMLAEVIYLLRESQDT